MLHHPLIKKSKRIENIRCFPEALIYSKDMTNTQNKIEEAKEKAAVAWARWATANDNAKKAFIAFRNIYSERGDHGTYKKYEQACEDRDAEYKEATEADEEVWRFESVTEEGI